MKLFYHVINRIYFKKFKKYLEKLHLSFLNFNYNKCSFLKFDVCKINFKNLNLKL